MGNDQSQMRAAEEQRKRQIEIERQRKVKEEEERQKKKREEEEMQTKNELENKKLQFQHDEEMQRIANQEKRAERSNALADKKGQLEHERLLQNQDKVLSIVGSLFQKVEITDMRDAAFGAAVLQSIQAGKPVDKDVLKAVTDKIANPPPTDIRRLVHNVIRTCEEAEDDENDQENIGISNLHRQRSNDVESV